ncbi:hypothetical protein A3A67_00135 [Candidatus Peribacteria bacterium RIFCSPLOWO2_01_FULL_51_18]|nr:MAG: hypothetical protein A3A67_00135 [Candidatus Peribacteria bacterium RIFCSPLOWO2_01_FULL_51_18]OGJ69183.1 MAG: hypothetical protein A3J34_02595 [Candidatus Peribacteria bacterium RIFCSPLOWO2_02_FULL_51_10]
MALIASPTSTLTVGIDEAGRGALAGPVTAAACVLPARKRYPVLITDSKQMTPAEREESFAWLVKNCFYGVGMADAKMIDRIGILASTEIAMQQAVAQVAQISRKLYLLVDGRDAFWFGWPHSSIIGGDLIEPCIGAASIIAKVTRDRHMIEAAKKYGKYGFAQHKGYGVPEHQASILKHGPSEFHRMTFLSKLLPENAGRRPAPIKKNSPKKFSD